jgi:hypothetical protein
MDQQHLPGDEPADPAESFLLALKLGLCTAEICVIAAGGKMRRRLQAGLHEGLVVVLAAHQGEYCFLSRL